MPQHLEAGETQMNRRAVRYAIVIEKAGSNYSAYAPDLLGVITTGATPECTERNMRQAIAFHLRELRAAGEPIPAPTTRATYVAAR
jgi:predicted RNase H-like HicB family nuclease